jgi:hypothetical protein
LVRGKRAWASWCGSLGWGNDAGVNGAEDGPPPRGASAAPGGTSRVPAGGTSWARARRSRAPGGTRSGPGADPTTGLSLQPTTETYRKVLAGALTLVVLRVRGFVALRLHRTVHSRPVVHRRDVLLRRSLGSARLRLDGDIKKTSFGWLFFIVDHGIVRRP